MIALIIEGDGKGFKSKSNMNCNKASGYSGYSSGALIRDSLKIESVRGRGTTALISKPVKPDKMEKH